MAACETPPFPNVSSFQGVGKKPETTGKTTIRRDASSGREVYRAVMFLLLVFSKTKNFRSLMETKQEILIGKHT